MWILLLLVIAPFTPAIDLTCAHYFYSPESGFYNNLFFEILFKYGELFGLASGELASAIFLLSCFRPRWRKWRQGTAAMILTIVLGAGILTNLGLKEYWGRPRPKQLIEFGGTHEYRPFWKPDFHTGKDHQRSFPSGHVAMGFYFLSLWLMGKRYNNKLLTYSGLFLVIFLGGGLMVARVAQGGHFFSDVIVSPLLMWYVAKWADRFTSVGWGAQVLRLNRDDTSQPPVPPRKA